MSPLDVGFDFWFLNVNVKVFVIVKFVYVQVNGTQEYVQDSLNTTTVVVLEVLFPYGFINEIGPPMSQKQVKESQSCVTPPLFAQAGVGRDTTALKG